MVERAEKDDREDYGSGREKYDSSRSEGNASQANASESEDRPNDEVGYSHGYYGGFGREGKMFGDRTEEISEPEPEEEAAGEDKK